MQLKQCLEKMGVIFVEKEREAAFLRGKKREPRCGVTREQKCEAVFWEVDRLGSGA